MKSTAPPAGTVGKPETQPQIDESKKDQAPGTGNAPSSLPEEPKGGDEADKHEVADGDEGRKAEDIPASEIQSAVERGEVSWGLLEPGLG
jgi:hypothetical protein